MGTIVVGIDGSDGSADALRWAVDEAALRGLSTTAVWSGRNLDEWNASGEVFQAGADGRDEAERAGLMLHAFVHLVLGEEVGGTVDELVVLDHPSHGLLQSARHAELLVVGARGLGGFQALLLGSVSQQCVQHSEVPVVVIRPTDPRPSDATPRVVVGIDGSAGSHAALEWAADEARLRRAELQVIHSWHMPYTGGYPYAIALEIEPIRKAAEELVAKEIASIDASDLAVPPVGVVADGGAQSALVEASVTADLVVVGARGLGAFRGMVVGSVSQAVMHHARCAVVVIPSASDG